MSDVERPVRVVRGLNRVAAEARCSPSTVHHYLREARAVSASMEWRIRNAALTLGIVLPWPRPRLWVSGERGPVPSTPGR